MGAGFTWDTQDKTNVKWAAKVGSRAYAMTIADGKIFVGTNNQYARNPRDTRKRKDGKTEPIDKSNSPDVIRRVMASAIRPSSAVNDSVLLMFWSDRKV